MDKETQLACEERKYERLKTEKFKDLESISKICFCSILDDNFGIQYVTLKANARNQSVYEITLNYQF